jgi:DNA primase
VAALMADGFADWLLNIVRRDGEPPLAHTIPDETISRIKNAADIVDVVEEYVVLKRSGRNYLGLCPFHAEKTPSFTVSHEKQMFYCFGCHTGGNVFSFIMQHEGLSFPEAVRMLAGRCGIEVPDRHMSAEQKKRLSEKDKLFRINELAANYFQHTLNDARIGQQAKAYLLGRGMTKNLIEGHRLGYAPDRWDGLLRHLESKRVPLGLIATSGLIVQRKGRNGYYDRFRNRIIFPIVNLNQQVVGFGGRVLGDGMPKYLNSPETPIYNKSGSLYGIDRARQSARAASSMYVVEGYFDALAMHLYGIENSVATLGTALTPEHVQLLKGMVGESGRVVLVYDSDRAGIKAAQRSIPVFEQGFLDARILVLPEGYDPDDFLRERGPDAFLKRAKKAQGMVPFLIDSAIQRHGMSIAGKVNIVSAMQAPLANVRDSVARSLYIQQLSEKLNIDESVIMQKIRQSAGKKTLKRHRASAEQVAHVIQGSRRLECQILAMMMRYPLMIPEIVQRNVVDFFEDASLRGIAQMILGQGESGAGDIAAVVDKIEDPQYRNLVSRLAFDEQRWDRQGCERLLGQFEQHHNRRSASDLQRRIEAAERNNDVELVSKLLEQKQRHAVLK